MKNLVVSAALFASIGAAYAVPTVTTNLVLDGGFEQVSQASGTYGTYATIPGWKTVSGAGIEVRNHDVGNAFEGKNYVELDSRNNSAMSQTIATAAGKSYTLSFEYSARAGVPCSSNPIEVLWDGREVALVDLDGRGQSGNVWHAYSYTVKGTGSDTLTFAARGTSDSLGGSLDAVSLTGRNTTLAAAVPEPSSYALMLGGLALVGTSLRKRRTVR